MQFRVIKTIAQSLWYFFLAGLCEIGGGYLVWLWLKEDYAWPVGILGGLILFLYGIIPTVQSSHFYKVYSAYGGVFVVMSLLWGWIFDGTRPDRFDLVGALVVLIGVALIFYYPKNNEQLWRA